MDRTYVRNFIDDELVDENDASAVRRLHDAFRSFGKKIYLVGGCVRDLLLRKAPTDFDFCTDAKPNEIKEIVSTLQGFSTYDSGIKHGTITAVLVDECKSYEITTFRNDGVYSDGRHPDSVEFASSLEEDLKRRDFTINAMAYDLKDSVVLTLDDKSMDDMRCGVIRTVGDPDERFSEDALRMLRAIRFCAKLGFSMDVDTYRSIVRNAKSIENISKERIRDELTKILMSDSPELIGLLASTRIERYAFSGMGKPTFVSDMLSCAQKNKYHYTDVFHHSIDVVRRLPKDVSLRWAGFLHDVGKPYVVSNDGEYDHFYGHADVSESIAKKTMAYLRFDKAAIEKVAKFVKMHDYCFEKVGDAKFKSKVAYIGKSDFVDFLKLLDADARAHSFFDCEYALCNISYIKSRFERIRVENEPISVKDLKVNGDDLIGLGLKGKEIGDMLKVLLDFVLENAHNNDRTKLLERAKSLIEKERPS